MLCAFKRYWSQISVFLDIFLSLDNSGSKWKTVNFWETWWWWRTFQWSVCFWVTDWGANNQQYCERSPPGLTQLKCWPDEQRTPLRDGDHSWSYSQWVSGFLSHCSWMLPEQFRNKCLLAGSEKNSSSFDKAPKIRDSVQIISWDSF